MKKLLLVLALLLTLALVGCEDEGDYWQAEDYYTQEEVDEMFSELELLIDNLEEIIFENQRRLDKLDRTVFDIEIMYGKFNGVEVSMDDNLDNDYVLVMVGTVEYKTYHISNETTYWGSGMVVIRINDVYYSFVQK